MNTIPVPINAPWRITLLGGLAAAEQNQNRTITRFRSHKYGALLAYLAYHLRGSHSREMLIALLWPEMSERAGRNNLSVALSSLRNQLEPPGTPQGTILRADRFSMTLNPAAVTTDVAEFELAIRQAGQAAGAVERAPFLARAMELYAGPLLPGYDEEWIAGERERLSGLFFDALSLRITDLEHAGDLPTALYLARQGVAADPLREEGQTHLIRLLAATGQPGAAVRQYKEFERSLDEELGDEPSAPLRALLRRIERESGFTGAPDAPSPPRPAIAAFVPPETGTRRSTLTFLLTDIEEDSAHQSTALEAHRALIRDAITRYGGQEVTAAGDSFVVAFSHAGSALACAVAAQQRLASYEWPAESVPIRVRMALHTGDVEQGADGKYHGQALHQASRMVSAAHGGQVLLSEITASLVRPDLSGLDGDIRLVDLGVHRLRDVPGHPLGPERLFQVDYPDMTEAGFGPLTAEAGYATNLPLTFTRFFGRTREIAELTQTLGDARTRLLTITGPGGTGKTRLAVEAAGSRAASFDGAVWFAPLADLSDPALIPGAVLDALREPRSPQREPLDQVVEALNKQPSLLLLDNFEHLIAGGGGADVVHRLLTRVPDLTVLVTSRQVLGVDGERELPLSPLPTPGGEAGTPERLSLFDSVALFIDRAQAVKPDFQVTNHNAPALAELCDRLEGIPLAIELAAARALVLTPAQMLAQMANRFAFLTSRRRGVVERQSTLRGAVDWSYRLLSPELQRFFCQLSVFRGGWTAEAAEEVCEEPLALDYLAQLRECSLVLAQETDDGEMRFFLLETLREYGEEQLTPPERSALHQRHLDYFLKRAETEPYAGWITEMENVRCALEWCKSGGDAKGGLRLAGALAGFWWYQGFLQEGNRHLADLLSRQETNTPDAVRATALGGRAWILVRLGRLREACSLYEERLHICRLLADRQGVAGVLNTLGDTLRWLGRHDESRALLQESLSLDQELANPDGLNAVFRDLADLAIRLGDFAEARHLLRESDAAVQETRNMTPLRLAEIALFEGDYEMAIRLGEEQVIVRRGAPQRTGEALLIIGGAALCQGDLNRAHSCFTEGLRRFHEIGSRLYIPRALRLLAYLAIRQDEFARATRLLGAAEARSEALETPLPPCERGEHDRHVHEVRTALGCQAFAAAWDAGRALTWEQAVAYALEESV